MPRQLSAFLRLATALAIFGSIFWQVSDRLANDLFRPQEYFFYFTIQTALISATVLTISGIGALRGKPQSLRLSQVRLWVVSYEVVVAIVYNALLRGTEVLPGDPDYGYDWPVLPNEILHVWAPIFILIDWALSKDAAKIGTKKVWWVVAYPLTWLAVSILRGAFAPDHWWAYWFLDPAEGVAQMLTYIFGISAFMIVAGFGFNALRNLIAKAQR
ncbi:MAG: hypothetical protein RI919_702 [Actinomycetota bacterium]|jgi:hypothetical protein